MKYSSPLLSLVVPVTVDSAGFVNECIKDLEEQSIASDIEVILIGRQELLNNLLYETPKNITVREVTRETNSEFVSWNEGIRKSIGSLVSVIHPADRYRKDAFEQFADVLEGHGDVQLVYSDVLLNHREHETFEAQSVRIATRFPDYDRKTFLERGFTEIRPVWRKNLHDQFGLLDEGLCYAADLEFWLRVSEEPVFYHIPEFLALRFDGNDIDRIANDRNRRIEFTSFLTYYENGYSKSNGLVSERVNRLKRIEELFSQETNKVGWKILEGTLAEDPSDSELWVLKMRLLMKAGDSKEAKQTLSEASKRFPNDVRLANQRAIFLWREGYRQQAQTVLEEIISRNPMELEARVTLVEAYSETGNISKAVDQLLFLINRVGDNRELYVSLIAKLLEQGEQTKARYYYHLGTNKYPADQKLVIFSHLIHRPKFSES